MLVNPLFDQSEDSDKQQSPPKQGGYALHNHKGKTIQPLSKDLAAAAVTAQKPQGTVIPADPRPAKPSVTAHKDEKSDPAIELIRSKVAALYAEEPDTEEELAEVAPLRPPLSKHQQFMQNLSTSGKSLAQIQTEWHEYYAALPDNEKHEVWREFYDNNARNPSAYTTFAAQQAAIPKKSLSSVAVASQAGRRLPNLNFTAKKVQRGKRLIKKQIIDKVNLSAQTQRKAKQHFQSLIFGLSSGAIVLLVFLFSFFNEMIIAPFIQPSRHVSATPIIINSDSMPASETPEVIIPKINVQIPTVFDEKSMDETAIQRGLERGVIHYPSTVLPGQQGNSVFFGHSSNNIFNKGAYKFAFVKLRELVPGDIFYLTYDKKVYGYRVYATKIVPPSEVGVLNNVAGKAATATLITCDPPGTATNRLVVWGEQISPDPAGAPPATTPIEATATDATVTELPSNGPTLWSRLWNSIF